MGLKLNVNTRIKINGREYASVDELPPELRKAYEAALRGAQGAPGQPAGARIVVNGTAYDSPEHMPPDVRKLYELAMAATEGEEAAAAAAPAARAAQGLPPAPAPSAAPGLGASPARQPSRKLLFWIGAALVAVLLWIFLSNLGAKPF